jgi:hypothetical protein
VSVCVCVFLSRGSACVVAKLSGMSGLAVVGARHGRTGQWHARIVGVPRVHVPGSCRTGRGVSC